MTGQVLLVIRLLLTASLFVFLGWVLVILLRGLRDQASLLASRKVPPLSLMVQITGKPPQMMNFSQAEINIGRDPSLECKLDDETVSARHARLSYHHSQWWVEDLTSTNGSQLNDAPLTTPTVIISGDKIQCGKTTLTVILTGDSVVEPTLQL